jgi:hypothetical protein
LVCPLSLSFDFSVLEMKGFCFFFSLIVYCFLCFHEDGKQTMVMLVVNNLWFSGVLFFFFLQGQRQWQGWSVTLLCLSLLLCIYIFWVYVLFLFFCDLLCFWVLFLFLTLYFFVCFVCSVFLGFFSFALGFLLPFIETHSLPLISPVFVGLYCHNSILAHWLLI